MNKGFGLVGVIISILIILVVGTAGVYVVKKTDYINNGSTTIKPGWKLYTDETNGFEIQYPENIFFLVQSTISPTYLNFTSSYNTSKLISVDRVDKLGKEECYYGLSGKVSVCSEGAESGIEFFLINASLENLTSSLTRKSNVSIDGKQSIKYNTGAEGSGVDFYYIPISENTTFVILREYVGEGRDNTFPTKKSFNEVISTLKFTELELEEDAKDKLKKDNENKSSKEQGVTVSSSKAICNIKYIVPEELSLQTTDGIESKYLTSDAQYGDYTITSGPYAFYYDKEGSKKPNIVKNILISGAELITQTQDVNKSETETINDIEKSHSLEGDTLCKTTILENGLTMSSCHIGFESVITGKKVYFISDKCIQSFKIIYNSHIYMNEASQTGNNLKEKFLSDFQKIIDSVSSEKNP